MHLQTESYLQAISRLPKTGRHVLAYQQDENLVVYQVYKPAIAVFAVKHQTLGGTNFSYNRMSWIKPDFLWMMSRCGWANKENQERVLAITLSKHTFEAILREAVHATFHAACYHNIEHWKQEMALKDVCLQWDPDHDPYGNKLERRAIQLGLKGQSLRNFA